jgi:hypothetical protein
MLKIKYCPDLVPNGTDLGLVVENDAVFAPETLRPAFESLGIRNSDSLAAALQSFPTAIAAEAGVPSDEFAEAVARALDKLRPYLNPRMFAAGPPPVRRGMGALPPDWLRKRS